MKYDKLGAYVLLAMHGYKKDEIKDIIDEIKDITDKVESDMKNKGEQND
ncbi:hypothetical protein [Bacillus amyloliquefaciens]|nr:hypothetical protein [Bacillus amyloliquefaciens]MEC3841544.1 hypothetical protein [Bacillus amyloliquefaciens]